MHYWVWICSQRQDTQVIQLLLEDQEGLNPHLSSPQGGQS